MDKTTPVGILVSVWSLVRIEILAIARYGHVASAMENNCAHALNNNQNVLWSLSRYSGDGESLR